MHEKNSPNAQPLLPLNALRAFEAIARHMSFARAAEELHVTPAALSHQIRGLEEQLGLSLFTRRTRSIELTEAGRTLYPGLHAGFESVRSAVARLDRERDGNILVISATVGLTSKWLMPRLWRFLHAHPEIDARVAATMKLADFAGDGVDVAIRMSTGDHPDLHTVVYLSAHPEVKAAGINPLTHYDTVGWTQGLVPSVRFDTDAYLKAYPDVAAAHVDPLAHFLQFGQQEGRTNFVPSSMLAENGFDFVYYLRSNPDVVLSNADPLQHFQTIGWKEGRDPNAYFDTDGYLANYSDVKGAGVNPLDHYHAVGWHDGRDPSVNFDTTSYLGAYPDVAAANVDPLKHFIAVGLGEGRQAFPDGLWS